VDFFFFFCRLLYISLPFSFFLPLTPPTHSLFSPEQSRLCSSLNRSTQWRKILGSFSSRCTAVEISARSSWWSATHSRVWTGLFSPHLTHLSSAYPACLPAGYGGQLVHIQWWKLFFKGLMHNFQSHMVTYTIKELEVKMGN